MTDLYYIYYGIIFFITGACFGSFFRCMADRSISGEKIGFTMRSHCDFCGHELTAFDLLPIIGFIVLKGRCRYCNSKLPYKLIISEIFLGVVSLLLFLRFDFSLGLLKGIFITFCLFVAALIDIDTLMVPNVFFILMSMVWVCFIPFEGEKKSLLISSFFGGFIIPGVIFIVSKLIKIIKHKDGIGGGDIKLLFAVGLFLGLERSILNIILMCVLGLITAAIHRKKPGEAFAFVPSILLSTIITWLYGLEIIALYLSLFGLEVRVN